MAHHDVLTELPNRLLLRERLERAVLGPRREEELAVLCLDLDRFKVINDTLGHASDDALLKAVGERLRTCVRDGDTVARLGGDEFSIVQLASEQPATALATRIIAAIAAPFDLGNHQVTVGTSIGVAVYPADGDNPDQLLKNADLALYCAKNEGRGVHRFFEADMDKQMQARSRLHLDLRTALAEGQFELHYQPLANLESNAISGLEALLRWQHPTQGMVAPAEFVPLAEESGLIVPLDWRRARLGGGKIGAVQKLPRAENQRRTFAVGRLQHAAQKHQMVAAVHGGLSAALEGCQAVGDQRTAAVPAGEGNAGEFVVPARRKMAGQRLLLGAEDADREKARARKAGKGRRLAVKAPQHQGRLERNGGKGVGGEADEVGFRRAGGNHGHAGGKAPERLAQAGAVQHIPIARDDLVRHAKRAPLRIPPPCRTGQRALAWAPLP